MYKLLIFLMVTGAVVSFRRSPGFETCGDQVECTKVVEKMSRKALTVDWRPISVFPEDAARFKK
jgi:hypothetical protein